MGLDDYKSAQGEAGALDAHAEELFSGFDEDQRAACELLLRRISRLTPDGRTTRDPTSLGELRALAKSRDVKASAFDGVIERLRQPDCAFIAPRDETRARGVSGKASDDDVDVTHEAFLRSWRSLVRWIKAERQDALTYTDIASGQKLFAAKQGQLLAGRRLSWAVSFWRKSKPTPEWASRYQELAEDISRLGLDERLERHRRRFVEVREFLRRSQWQNYFQLALFAGIGALAFVVSVLGTNNQLLKQQRDEATKQTRLAEEARAETVRKNEQLMIEKNKATQALKETQEAQAAEREANREKDRALDAARAGETAAREAEGRAEDALKGEKAARKEAENAQKQEAAAHRAADSAKTDAEKARDDAESARVQAVKERDQALSDLRRANEKVLAATALATELAACKAEKGRKGK